MIITGKLIVCILLMMALLFYAIHFHIEIHIQFSPYHWTLHEVFAYQNNHEQYVQHVSLLLLEYHHFDQTFGGCQPHSLFN